MTSMIANTMRACEREFVQMKKQEVLEELQQLKKKHKEAHKTLSKETKSNIRKYRRAIDQRIREEQDAGRKEAEEKALREWADVVFHYWIHGMHPRMNWSTKPLWRCLLTSKMAALNICINIYSFNIIFYIFYY